MNYKIEVKSEAESKEVQGLFGSLGLTMSGWSAFAFPKYIANFVDGEFSDYSIYDNGLRDWKAITIQELRALASLHKNPINMDKVLSEVRSDALGLLEDKPMKEYLNKLTDGTYKLVVLSDVIDGHDGLIKIPEGATAARLCDDVEFYKNDFDMFFSRTSGNWLNTISTRGVLMKNIVWQRHTQPEELPFVDDEPSLNDQYAEIEQVRKEYKLKNDMSVDDYIDTIRCEDTVNHPSHYASGEIECIDAMEAMLTPEQFIGYLRGNSFKYMWRYENKGGITDLEKAQWYLNKLISRVG